MGVGGGEVGEAGGVGGAGGGREAKDTKSHTKMRENPILESSQREVRESGQGQRMGYKKEGRETAALFKPSRKRASRDTPRLSSLTALHINHIPGTHTPRRCR